VANPLQSPNRSRLFAIVVFVVALAGMSRVMGNTFVDWDDSFTLYANAKMNPPTAETLRFYWTSGEHGLYMPATQTIWAGLATIAYHQQPDDRGMRLSPRVFHATSVLLHACAAVFAFLLLRRLIHNDWAAAIGAGLFALHPVQVESVAWASGMKDVLCGLFSLVALWQFVAAVQADRRWNFVVATIAFALAMLCKPAAMVLPAVAMVIHILLLHAHWKTAAKWTVIWWPMAIVVMIVARVSQPVTIPGPAIWQRPLVALDALAFYLGKIIFPWTLCIDYGRTPPAVASSGSLWWTWLIPAAIAAIVIWKPRREVIAAGIIASLCVAPVLGFTPFMFQIYSTVSDHYVYLAMIGPALLLAWLVTINPTVVRPAACVVLAVLAAKSFTQQSTWRDDESLFSHTLAANPRSFMAANNLASAYQNAANVLLFNAPLAEKMGDRATAAACRQQARQNLSVAAQLYAKSIEIRKQVTGGVDNYVNPHIGLAETQAKLKELDSPTTPASASTN
jgi:hypothetical protein